MSNTNSNECQVTCPKIVVTIIDGKPAVISDTQVLVVIANLDAVGDVQGDGRCHDGVDCFLIQDVSTAEDIDAKLLEYGFGDDGDN